MSSVKEDKKTDLVGLFASPTEKELIQEAKKVYELMNRESISMSKFLRGIVLREAKLMLLKQKYKNLKRQE